MTDTRKVIYSTYATLDGKVDTLQEWASPWNGEALAQFHADLLADSDGLLLGRVAYQVFSQIWPPRAGVPYADKINSMAKYVASTTLTDADLKWENSHLIDGDAVAGVTKLKQQPGQDLVVYGGLGIVRTLRDADLIDEYRIVVHPVLLGKGSGIVEEGARRVDLELVDTSVISPGLAVLVYRPVR